MGELLFFEAFPFIANLPVDEAGFPVTPSAASENRCEYDDGAVNFVVSTGGRKKQSEDTKECYWQRGDQEGLPSRMINFKPMFVRFE